MTGKAALTVYVREYCHLCHEMVAAIEALQPVYAFDLKVIDVDEDMALESRYGNLVPVLTANDEEICHYRLDPAALDAYFGKIR